MKTANPEEDLNVRDKCIISEDKGKTLRKTKDFIDAGLIQEDAASSIDKVSAEFSFAITPTMLKQIKSSDKNDAIAKQFVPTIDELNITKAELLDPIGDDEHTSVKGIIHRYPDRCLFKPVNVCPVYCRFCFRREKVGPGNKAMSPKELEQAYNYIASNSSIWEVILTGGDPLIIKPKQLAGILYRLDEIEHVGVIRLHTRIPIVDPERINDEMISALKLKNKPTYIVIHANHPDEFSTAAEQACSKLVDSGIPLLSQSVLLRGINDDHETMGKLMRTFIKNRIKPYYLHHGDMAKGTGHFRTSIADGQQIMRSLRGNVSGICQPTYVLDIPGGYGKVPINHSYLKQTESLASGRIKYQVEDYQANIHDYTSE